MKHLVCLAFVLLVSVNFIDAQLFHSRLLGDTLQINFDEVASSKVVRFQLCNSLTSEPVVLAHIVNLRKRLGVISDMHGYFSMPISFGDSLQISAIGYHTKSMLCLGVFFSDSLYTTIALSPKSYPIEEVKITRLTTYERFLKSVLNLRLPKSEFEMQMDRIDRYMESVKRRAGVMNLPQATSGVMFGKDWFVKQKEKLNVALVKERNSGEIFKKFSPGMVESISGLKGDSLLKFIGYLNFSDAYLLSITEYEIRVEILTKLKSFRANASTLQSINAKKPD